MGKDRTALEDAARDLEFAVTDTICELDTDGLIEIGAIVKGKNHPLVIKLAQLTDYDLTKLESVEVSEVI